MIYFVASDIHSFYDEFIEALSTAGYNKDNPEHILIVCGDIFDRGPKSKEIFQFLTSLPKERLILIRGNHEQLFLELIDKDLPERHDFTNGTVKTICQFYADAYTIDAESFYNQLCEDIYWSLFVGYKIDGLTKPVSILKENWKKIISKIKSLDIIDWLKSDKWRNYYELDNFIFVHSFIPLTSHIFNSYLNSNVVRNYLPEWRDASQKLWNEAVWMCPWELYRNGLFNDEEKNGKTLVCGHWHTADFYKYLKNDDTPTTNIYFSKGIIGLDGGVTNNNYELIYECNVLVIKDGVCYNKYGEQLE